MQHQSSTPGPEFGWAFGGLGFVVTIFVGWLIDVGVGFLLVAVVFWGGIGALFAFLVERSTIEEQDRVEELKNTRLATLAPAWVPERASRPAAEERTARQGDRGEDASSTSDVRRGTGPDAPATDPVPARTVEAADVAEPSGTAVPAGRRSGGSGDRDARDAAAAALLAGRPPAAGSRRDDAAPSGAPLAGGAGSSAGGARPDPASAGSSGSDPGRWNGARAGAARAAGASTPQASASTPRGSASDPGRWNGARMAASRAGDRDRRASGPADSRPGPPAPSARSGAGPDGPARPAPAPPRASADDRRPARPRRPEPDAAAQPQPRSPREYREARAAREDDSHRDPAAA